MHSRFQAAESAALPRSTRPHGPLRIPSMEDIQAVRFPFSSATGQIRRSIRGLDPPVLLGVRPSRW